MKGKSCQRLTPIISCIARRSSKRFPRNKQGGKMAGATVDRLNHDEPGVSLMTAALLPTVEITPVTLNKIL